MAKRPMLVYGVDDSILTTLEPPSLEECAMNEPAVGHDVHTHNSVNLSRDEVAQCVKDAIEMHYLDPNGNCAQSTACALCERLGVSKDEAFRAMEGFGGGMGCFSQTCGAVSGAVYLVGMANSAGIEDRTSKADTYQRAAWVVERFEQEFGSALCKDLRNPDPQVSKGICDGYIRRAVELAAQAIAGNVL